MRLLLIEGSYFTGGSEVKAPARNAGDLGSISGLGRFPGEENGNPLQYSCLENPMDRGAWWATVHGVAKSRKQLSDFPFTLETMEGTRDHFYQAPPMGQALFQEPYTQNLT